MRLYIATKWENREAAREFMLNMEDLGHTITYDWTIGEQQSAFQAMADLEGVRQADAVVFLADLDLRYTGALIEVGAALGLGKPVYVLGEAPVTETLFFKHPLVRHGTEVFTKEVINGV